MPIRGAGVSSCPRYFAYCAPNKVHRSSRSSIRHRDIGRALWRAPSGQRMDAYSVVTTPKVQGGGAKFPEQQGIFCSATYDLNSTASRRGRTHGSVKGRLT